jgi:hypothetical protein
MTLKPVLSIQTRAAKPEAVGLMELPTTKSLGLSLTPIGGDIPVTWRLIRRDEASLGTHPNRGRKLTRFLKKGSPIDQDTGGKTQRGGLEKL